MTTWFFIIVLALSTVTAAWAWALALSARSDARIAAEDIQQIIAELDVLHLAAGTSPDDTTVPDPDEPLDLVPIDPDTGTTAREHPVEEQFEDIDDSRCLSLDEWVDHTTPTPLRVLGSIPAENPSTTSKHRRDADAEA